MQAGLATECCPTDSHPAKLTAQADEGVVVWFAKPSALVGKIVLDVEFKTAVYQKADGQIMLSEEVQDMLQKKDELQL